MKKIVARALHMVHEMRLRHQNRRAESAWKKYKKDGSSRHLEAWRDAEFVLCSEDMRKHFEFSNDKKYTALFSAELRKQRKAQIAAKRIHDLGFDSFSTGGRP